MSTREDEIVRLLGEIRDQGREHLALYREAVKNQDESIRMQAEAVRMQRSAMRRLVPALLLLVIIAIAIWAVPVLSVLLR